MEYTSETFGLIANVMSNVAFLPQIIKSFKRKQVEDVSMGMFFIFFATEICWIAYAIPIHAQQLWTSSAIELILLLPMFFLWLRYGPVKEKGAFRKIVVDFFKTIGNACAWNPDQAPPLAYHQSWLIGAVAVVFVFFIQISAGVIVHQVIDSVDVNVIGTMTHLLSAAVYFLYVLFQFPAGILVDRFGPRRFLTLGGILYTLGCVWLVSFENANIDWVGQLSMIIGASFVFVSALYLVSEWFPAHRFALMAGFCEMMGIIGLFLGYCYVSPWLDEVHIGAVAELAGVIAFLLGLLAWTLVRDHAPEGPTDVKLSSLTMGSDVAWVASHPGLWLNGIYAGLLLSVVLAFGIVLGPSYLAAIQQVDQPIAHLESAMIFLGIAVGGPILGYWYSKIRFPLYFFLITAVIGAILLNWILYATPQMFWLNTGLFLMLGLVCSSYILNYALVNEFAPRRVRSTSIGFLNMISLLTALLFQPLIRALFPGFSLVEGDEGVGSLSHFAQYRWVLSLIPILLVLVTVVIYGFCQSASQQMTLAKK